MEELPVTTPSRRYRWPYVVLAAVILWFALAVFWMSFAVRHVEEQRDSQPMPPAALHH